MLSISIIKTRNLEKKEKTPEENPMVDALVQAIENQ